MHKQICSYAQESYSDVPVAPRRRTYSGTSIQRTTEGLAKFVRYNEFLLYRGCFSYIYYNWGKKNRSLYRGLRYIEVRYIEVLL